MTTFIENLVENSLSTNGTKPFLTSRELLKERKDLRTVENFFRPSFRGFFSKSWKHGSSLHSLGHDYAMELGDKLKFGQFFLKTQFLFQHGPELSYRTTIGLDLNDWGDLEFVHQAKNLTAADFYQISHYTSKNGLHTSANIIFRQPLYQPQLTLSSLYNQTIEVFDRKAMKLNKRVSTYGIDTSFSFNPMQQLHYSLYYQNKSHNCNFVAAYMRKNLGNKLFSNQIIAGMKFKTLDQKQLLAKASYKIEDKLPQLDLMIRKKHGEKKVLTTFHTISSNLRVGSGFTFNAQMFKIHGLAEVNLINSDLNLHPFNIGIRIEARSSEKERLLPKMEKKK